MPKKIKKFQRDIANAQAISGVPIDRDTWWQRLARASTQDQIKAVIDTPMLQDTTDEDTAKTVE